MARKINVVGFMHVCMVNDWYDIVSEQIQIMKDFGLYDYSRVINIGALGSLENKAILEKLIAENATLRLATYSENLNEYEFHTLKFLQEICKTGGFCGFYVHTKGVSWPGHEGGKHWRDYMNHYILRVWHRDLEMMEMGYDLCGVKLINKRWPLHYSGNFFWFKSEYISTLIPVTLMNLKDRFNAEMWVCSNQPIAGTLCQDFVDYDTKGVFVPKDLSKLPPLTIK